MNHRRSLHYAVFDEQGAWGFSTIALLDVPPKEKF